MYCSSTLENVNQSRGADANWQLVGGGRSVEPIL